MPFEFYAPQARAGHNFHCIERVQSSGDKTSPRSQAGGCFFYAFLPSSE